MAAGPRKLLMALAMAASITAIGYQAQAATADVLSPADARAYRDAFAAASRGDFKAADAGLERVKDRSLIGHASLQKFMHPTAYKADFAELNDWLKAYGDHPGAERVYALALKRKPAGSAPPKPPAFLETSRGWSRIENAATRISGPAAADSDLAARKAYYSGDIIKALALAPAAGNAWIAGLAAWRLGRFEEAQGFFRNVAIDESNDEWLRAGGAFWAARASRTLGDAQQSTAYLRMAAKTPHSFYGMIAQRSLELDGVHLGSADDYGRQASGNEGLLIRVSTAPVAATTALPAIGELLRRDARARRAAALMQIGRSADAGLELRAGLGACRSAAERRPWESLILALNAPITTAADSLPPPVTARRATSRRSVGPASYPTPELWPEGGWTVDKALVYALIWKESGFNAFAVSGAGAMGLMQVRPTSAAQAIGDDHLIVNPMPLLDAPINLRVGQDYLTWLMERGLGKGPGAYDVLRIAAAYNAGAGTVLNTIKQVGPEADTLLLVESLPALETRDYVEKVMAAYWIYRRKFGSETATLDAVARGDRIIDIRLDR